MEFEKPIALIGFMGVGKTTLGKLLATRLCCQFVETDTLIEQRTQKTIIELFQRGESTFREYEAIICQEIVSYRNSVVSCGGGMIFNPNNLLLLQNHTHLILLTASFQEIYKRLEQQNFQNRPLINLEMPFESLLQLYNQRRPVYISATSHSINTENKPIDSILDELEELVHVLDGGAKHG